MSKRKPGKKEMLQSKLKEKEIQEIITPEQWQQMTTKDALAYWSALPKRVRNPATQKELAKIMGVSQERLCQIKKEDGFYEQVHEYRKEFFKKFTSEVIDALRVMAELGDTKSAKLFLQYIEDFKETSRQEREITEKRELVFILGESKWAELKKELTEITGRKQLKYLKHEKVEPDEEAELCESMPNDRT